MANDGTKIVINLDQMIPPYPPPNPTGVVKPNIQGDPNYIAPYLDLVDCPVTGDATCPVLQASGGNDQIEYEFSIPNSVLMNTSIVKVRIRIMDSTGTTEESFVDYTFPMSPSTNYKYALISPVTVGTHQIDAQYLNSVDSVVANCSNLDSVIVT